MARKIIDTFRPLPRSFARVDPDSAPIRKGMAMILPICETCGTQYAETPAPPAQCPVCEDERQYVGWNGQAWTTHEELGARHTLRLEDDHGLLGIGLTPAFAIDLRPLYWPTDAGNILWECVSLVTADAVAALNARGGVDRIIISHPHFYASMVEWSEALGGVPILIHEADIRFSGSKRSEIVSSGDLVSIIPQPALKIRSYGRI
jgi:hypothetical protein